MAPLDPNTVQAIIMAATKIEHDDNCFAMLNMPYAVRNSGFEGSKPEITLNYYRSLLDYKDGLFDASLSLEMHATALNAVDELIYFYNLIYNKKNLEVDFVIAEIKSHCQNHGFCYFPSGWIGDKRGHFAALKFRVLADGRYTCVIINRGAGAEYHRVLKRIGNSIELDIQSHEFALDLNGERGKRFLLGIIALRTDPRPYDDKEVVVSGTKERQSYKLQSNVHTIKPYSAEDLYALLEFYGEPICNAPVPERAREPQVTGTCSITSIEAVVHDVLLTRYDVSFTTLVRLDLSIRLYSIIEAFKAKSEYALLEWAIREFNVRIVQYAPEMFNDDEVIISTQVTKSISDILTLDHAKQIEALCLPKPLPALKGKWTANPSVTALQSENVKQPESAGKQNISVLSLDSNGCKAVDILSYLDQAIVYFKENKEKFALTELRMFMHSLAIPSGNSTDAYWDLLSAEQAALVINKLHQLMQLMSCFKSQSCSLEKPYKFEIALIAYDIAAQLATKLSSLSLNGYYALGLDDVFTHQHFFHDAYSYQTIKRIALNFQRRCSGKGMVFGNSLNYHDSDATQKYVMSSLLTSEKKKIAIRMLKEKEIIAAHRDDVDSSLLFSILVEHE